MLDDARELAILAAVLLATVGIVYGVVAMACRSCLA